MQITEKLRNAILKWLYGGGYVLLILGIIFYFSKISLAPYAYSLGAVFMVVVRIILPINQTDQQTKRLSKIHAFATLVLVASVYFMFTREYHQFWLPSLLLATSIDLWISFRLPKK